MKRLLAVVLIIAGFVSPLWAGGQRVVMVIAHQNFRDEELFITKQALEKSGFKVDVASSSLSVAKGMLGGRCKPDILLKDINLNNYSAIIFVGGSGATEYWDNPMAHRLAQEAVKRHKLVAAICIAPIILARAGVLQGKRATVWSSEAEGLKAAGAIYTGAQVEKDGLIITANGPWAAKEFARTIIETLRRGIH